MNYYGMKDGEMVHTLDYFEDMIDENLKEITLYEMRRDYGSGQMWCEESNFMVEDDDCGYDCPLYNPCNYIKGRCRRLANCFVETGKKFILTKDGLMEVLIEGAAK